MSETRTVNVRFPLLVPSLVIIFVIAKLTGHFDYSWWWVFSPLWIPAAAILGLYLAWVAIWCVLFVVSAIFALCVEGPKYFSKETRVRRKNANNARKALDAYARVLTRRNRG